MSRKKQERASAQTSVSETLAVSDLSVYPVPAYVERDLRMFLEGGILAHGFARA